MRRGVKIVVAGPVNAGKTTLIHTLSDLPVVCTNEQATDAVVELKEQTTVAMDHGICMVDPNWEIHLYGTPGQRRFDFMWEILAVGADAVLLLVDGSDPDSVSELRYIYAHFDQRHDMPLWVGVTRSDHPASRSAAEIATMLDLPTTVVVGCDPRSRFEMATILTALIHSSDLDPAVLQPV